MKKLLGISLLSTLMFASSHWSYEGHTGPKYWGDLDHKFVMCKMGKNQSPIDINKNNLVESNLMPLNFEYKSIAKNVVDNGHTIKVSFNKGSYLYVDGKKFELKQFHFHTPSENTINGKHFPMEAHFVHLDKNGDIAVVAVMFEKGKENKALKVIEKSMPTKHQTKNIGYLNGMDLLPKNKDYYRFNGSLTTPPCSEGVRWFVMKIPVSLSESQLKAFSDVMGKNNRPVQSINARKVLK